MAEPTPVEGRTVLSLGTPFRPAPTLQTPGGTGALRVASDFVKQMLPTSRIWCTDPTWPNHPKVFAAAGLKVETFPYFDAAHNRLDFDALMEGKASIPGYWPDPFAPRANVSIPLLDLGNEHLLRAYEMPAGAEAQR